jgi:hypothetical protein
MTRSKKTYETVIKMMLGSSNPQMKALTTKLAKEFPVLKQHLPEYELEERAKRDAYDPSLIHD